LSEGRKRAIRLPSPIRKLSISRRWFLLAIFVLAFLARMTYFGVYGADSSFGGLDAPPMETADDIYYDQAALSLIDSGLSGYARSTITETHSLYVFFLAGIYSIFGHSYAAVRMCQALLDAVTCVVAYFIGRELFSERVGRLSALYAGIYPLFIYLSGRFLSETLFAFLLALSVLFFTRASRGWWTRNSFLAGIFLGLSILARGMLLAFLAMIPLWALVVFRERKKAILASAAVLLAGAAVAAPVLALTYTAPGESSTNGSIWHFLWLWNNQRYREWAVTMRGDGSQVRKLFLDYITQHPGRALKGVGQRLVRFWHFDSQSGRPEVRSRYRLVGFLSYGVLLPFILLGLFLSLRKWRKNSLLYLLVAYFAVVSSLLSTEVRKRAPIDIYLIMFGMFGMVYLIEWLRRVRVRRKRVEGGHER